MDDWMVHVAGLKKVEPMRALWVLYQSVVALSGSEGSFSRFAGWGTLLLSDFEEMEKYLVDHTLLFQNLSDLHDIEKRFPSLTPEELEFITGYWKTFQPKPSVYQESWLGLWARLGGIYERFTECLLSEGSGTSGICSRRACDEIQSGRYHERSGYKGFAFVGFNVLTRAEEQIFEFFKGLGSAWFYWDFDPLLHNPEREAGRFVAAYASKFPPPEGFRGFDILPGASPAVSREVQVVSAGTLHAQMQLACREARRLAEFITPGNDESVGIILPDESEVIRFLTAWGSDMSQVNLTMGWPVVQTRVAGLFGVILRLPSVVIRKDQFSYIPVGLIRDLINHPFMEELALTSDEKRGSLAKLDDSAWVTTDEILDLPLLGDFFPRGENQDLVSLLLKACKMIEPVLNRFDPVEEVTHSMLVEWLQNLDKATADSQNQPGPEELSTLFEMFFLKKRVTIESDPKAPVQVCGMLETRLMDYDHLLILSFNEGVWPSGQLPGSMIPYSLRKAVGMPTSEHRDAMYAYYFYRLLPRCKSIQLYYTAGRKDEGGVAGEKSRYIHQLRHTEGFKVMEQKYSPILKVLNLGPVPMHKDHYVMQRLNDFVTEGEVKHSLSPTALTTYLECQLKFAYRYIHRLREPDQLPDITEPRVFGQILHGLMEDLYKPFQETEIGPENDWFAKLLDDSGLLEEALNRRVVRELNGWKPGMFRDGLVEITIGMIREYTRAILKHDLSLVPFRIMKVEQLIGFRFPFVVHGGEKLVRFAGKIDRIDQKEGEIRVIDYKTGDALLDLKQVEDLFDMAKASKRKEIFQLMFYAEYLVREERVTSPLKMGLYRVRALRSGKPDTLVTLNKADAAEYGNLREAFCEGLSRLLAEIWEPDLPFYPTEDLNHCRYCEFASLCRRD